jgi:hypothetical protein
MQCPDTANTFFRQAADNITHFITRKDAKTFVVILYERTVVFPSLSNYERLIILAWRIGDFDSHCVCPRSDSCNPLYATTCS